MVSALGSLEPNVWRQFFRSILWRWRHYELLRVMDEATFARYSEESRSVQDALAFFASAREFPAGFLRTIFPSVERLLGRMFWLGDDITAYLLFRTLGDLLEDEGLDEEAARSMQFAGRCARSLRFHEEAIILLERALPHAHKATPDHPLCTEIYNLLGLVYGVTGRYDEAELSFQKSLAVLDKWPAATLRHHLWRPKYKLRGLRLTNMLDLHLLKARHVTGSARTKEIEVARALLQRAVESVEDEPVLQGYAVGNEAEILLVEGRLAEAHRLLSSEIERYGPETPASRQILPPLHRLLADVAAEEGKQREAYAHCREALQFSLRFANAHEEGLVVETTIDIMGRFIRPRLAGAGLRALSGEDRQVIQNLVLLLEGKDWYTGNNHSRAVSKLCRTLGSELQAEGGTRPGRPEPSQEPIELDTLEMAGLLHDIGKLRIPWSLLNKRNPLLPLEHRVLESHVSEGGSILKHLGFSSLARLVEEHHEKLDGSGYPSGKRKLSLMGSVIAVADSYEAMVTPNRRYTTPRRRSEALLELRSLAGKSYDHRVVGALERRVGRGRP
jgi:HD-GYP domain-containing protein (c-di-GMP phosphodiesterase class II)